MPDSTNELTAIASELREEAHRLRGIRYRDVTGSLNALASRLDALAARGEAQIDDGTAEPFLNAIESSAHRVARAIGWTEDSVAMGVRCARGAMDPRTWESPAPSDAASGPAEEAAFVAEVRASAEQVHRIARELAALPALTTAGVGNIEYIVQETLRLVAHSPAPSDAPSGPAAKVGRWEYWLCACPDASVRRMLPSEPVCRACGAVRPFAHSPAHADAEPEHEDGDRAVGMYLDAIADVMAEDGVNPNDVELVRYAGRRLRALEAVRQSAIVAQLAPAIERAVRSRPASGSGDTAHTEEARIETDLLFVERPTSDYEEVPVEPPTETQVEFFTGYVQYGWDEDGNTDPVSAEQVKRLRDALSIAGLCLTPVRYRLRAALSSPPSGTVRRTD